MNTKTLYFAKVAQQKKIAKLVRQMKHLGEQIVSEQKKLKEGGY